MAAADREAAALRGLVQPLPSTAACGGGGSATASTPRLDEDALVVPDSDEEEAAAAAAAAGESMLTRYGVGLTEGVTDTAEGAEQQQQQHTQDEKVSKRDPCS